MRSVCPPVTTASRICWRRPRDQGPLYKLRIFGTEYNMVSGLDLVTELSDETRFVKNVHPDLTTLREITGDGLISAHNDEPNWRKAHDILMSAFSLGAMRGYQTCEGIARDLAADGDEHGFSTTVAPLDDAVGKLASADGPVVIVAASYNGRPTDDATKFLAWTELLQPGSPDGVHFAVLGVGDRNWAATYQRVPTLIDERLIAAGATPLLQRGVADASVHFVGTSTGGPATCRPPCWRITASRRRPRPSRTATKGCTNFRKRRNRPLANSPHGTAYGPWRCSTPTNWSTWTIGSAARNASSGCVCPRASPTAPAITWRCCPATRTTSSSASQTASVSTWSAPSGFRPAAAAATPFPSTGP
jgi:hypothetical protein